MQLPRLELHNTFAKLGIEQSRSKISMRQPMADLKFTQPMPEVKIHTSKSKLEIDQTEAFADANLKNPLRVMNEWAAKAKQKMIQNIAQKANEGDRMMKIEGTRQNALPQIAKDKSQTPPKEVNIGFMPESMSKVKFRYQPSKVDIKVNFGKFRADVETHSPIIKFNQGDFRIYLKQKASLQINSVGATLDQKI
ncbi:DUF6470 family protein [Bacillus sp. S/N-304-OC-R1]|uniref:DUF6470 family protein n=1 Tax=Bacillus sp. S/N-304-OC-R1 TaxID=2758034 RepID=UPI001C8EE138|nr:DUF6470 family protein [Bacillus sp. S/N-304-OC-R1]MBY0123467.1 hypothetical protein [Bacillus sp. S/N-304-OC-R1]